MKKRSSQFTVHPEGLTCKALQVVLRKNGRGITVESARGKIRRRLPHIDEARWDIVYDKGHHRTLATLRAEE